MKTILLFLTLLVLCVFSNIKEDPDETESRYCHSGVSAG